MIVPWKSPLKPIFSNAVLKLRESGAIEYFKLLWEGKEVSSSEGIALFPLSLGQVGLAFLLFSLYCLISLIILGCEVVYGKCKKKLKAISPNQTEILDLDEAIINLQNIDLDLEYIKKKYETVQSYLSETSEQIVTKEVLESIDFLQQLQEFVKSHNGNGATTIEVHNSDANLSDIAEINIEEINIEDQEESAIET